MVSHKIDDGGGVVIRNTNVYIVYELYSSIVVCILGSIVKCIRVYKS